MRVTITGISGTGMAYAPMPAMPGQQNAQARQTGGTGQDFQLPPAPPGSPAHQLMEHLRGLQETDPDAFAQTASDIAAQLEDAAAQISGGAASGHLQMLAGKFSQAAEDGNLSAFGPPPPQGHMQAMAMPGMHPGQAMNGPAREQNFISQMQQLQTQAPDLFESLLNSVADAFKTAGADNSGSSTATLLNNLAARFTYAADTGDMSIFQTPPPMQTGAAAYAQGMGSPMPAMSRLDAGAIHNVLSDILENVKQSE